jgi:hypothetical protein
MLQNRAATKYSERWTILSELCRRRVTGTASDRYHWHTKWNYKSGDLKRLTGWHWWMKHTRFSDLAYKCQTLERNGLLLPKQSNTPTVEQSNPPTVKQESAAKVEPKVDDTAQVIVEERHVVRLDLQQQHPNFYMLINIDSDAVVIKWVEEFDDGPTVLQWYWNPVTEACSNVRKAYCTVESFRQSIADGTFVPLVVAREPACGVVPARAELLGYPTNSAFESQIEEKVSSSAEPNQTDQTMGDCGI